MHRHLHVLTLWACLVLGLLLPGAQADVTHLPPQARSVCSGLPQSAPLVAGVTRYAEPGHTLVA